MIDSLKTQFQSIIRTRRRAFALISGIVLATMIISGIFLYNSVLQTKNFQSIVGNTAYEVTFNKYNNESFASLNELGSNISNDTRVDAYSVVGGFQSNPTGNEFQDANRARMSLSIQTIANGTFTKENSRTGQTFYPIFVDQQFFLQSIGQSLHNDFYDGEFRMPADHEVIIPRALSTDEGILVGDTINQVNLTMAIAQQTGDTVAEDSMTNFTVIGVYEQAGGGSGGFNFGQQPILDYANVIFNQHLLETNATKVNNAMRQAGNFQLLVSIDETKFTVSDPTTFVNEIDTFKNQVSEKYGPEDVVGINLIQGALASFTIFSIIVSVMYFIISAPVIILSLYVLLYGLTVSLEERRREIQVKKVQGASSRQIFNEMRNETLLIYVLGIIIGYIAATGVAWLIGSAIGFFQIELGSFSDYIDYIHFDTLAVLSSVIVVGIMVIIMVYRTGKRFIDEEVTEAISRRVKQSYGFLRNTNLDLVLFGIGLIGLIISTLDQIYNINLNLTSFVFILIQLLTPIAIWLGGASVGSRLVQKIPQVLEPIYLRLFLFKDVSRIIKAGLRRRGDVNKLAIVIILSLAVASMSVMQGLGDEHQVQQNIQYQVGSDFRVITNGPSNISDQIQAISGVDAVEAIAPISGRILSSNIVFAGFDPAKELSYLKNGDSIMQWQKDTFVGVTVAQAMQELMDHPHGVFLTSTQLDVLSKSIGDSITIAIPLNNPTLNKSQTAIQDVKILGEINLMPGNLGGYALTSSSFAIVMGFAAQEISTNQINDTLINDNGGFAQQFQIKMKKSTLTNQEILDYKDKFLSLSGVSSVTSLQEELDNLNATGTGFGITGLLTLAAVIALVATFVSSFAFSSIIMERRKREFAVLRAIGAKKSQIYKMAMGENFLMMLIGVVWGTLIGVGVAIIWNGFFAFVSGELLRSLTVNREIIFPWDMLSIFGGITLLGMMFATLLSIRNSVNADLTTATRAE